MTVDRAQRILGIIWLTGTVLFAALVFAIMAGGALGERSGELSKWFVPYVFPTATLMIGVLVQKFRDKTGDAPLEDPFLFRLALVFQIVYFVALLVTIVTPFAKGSTDVIGFLTSTATVLLTPLQGLTTGILGAFFVEKKKS